MYEYLIDASVWAGNWPFVSLPNRDLPSLKANLSRHGIVRAYVSPIEAILERDPLRADRALLADAAGDPFFSPVPVVDLSYANWRDAVELADANPSVRMVRLLPSYHLYELTEDLLAPLVELTRAKKLVIAVQLRIEDERSQYPAMKIPAPDPLRLASVLAAFPDQPFLLCNAYLGELVNLLGAFPNLYADTASLETRDTFAAVAARFDVNHLLFSTHAAFYYPDSNVHSLGCSSLDDAKLRRIAYENAEALLG